MAADDTGSGSEKSFRGWRMVGIWTIVVVALAIAALLVDGLVLGPLLGRI